MQPKENNNTIMWSILSSVIERFVPISASPSVTKDVDQLLRDAKLHEAALAEYDKAANVELIEEPKQEEIKKDECFTNTGKKSIELFLPIFN